LLTCLPVGWFARGSINLEKRKCWSGSPLQAPPSLRYGGLTHAAPRPTFHIQTRCEQYEQTFVNTNFTSDLLLRKSKI
jgi:hypothetical protein